MRLGSQRKLTYLVVLRVEYPLGKRISCFNHRYCYGFQSSLSGDPGRTAGATGLFASK